MKRLTLILTLALLLLVVPNVFAGVIRGSGGGGGEGCVTPEGETCLILYKYFGSLNPKAPENHVCHDKVQARHVYPQLENQYPEVDVFVIFWRCTAVPEGDNGPGYSGGDHITHPAGNGRNESAKQEGNNGISEQAVAHNNEAVAPEPNNASSNNESSSASPGKSSQSQGQGNNGQGGNTNGNNGKGNK